jgi:hypothetical protein
MSNNSSTPSPSLAKRYLYLCVHTSGSQSKIRNRFNLYCTFPPQNRIDPQTVQMAPSVSRAGVDGISDPEGVSSVGIRPHIRAWSFPRTLAPPHLRPPLPPQSTSSPCCSPSPEGGGRLAYRDTPNDARRIPFGRRRRAPAHDRVSGTTHPHPPGEWALADKWSRPCRGVKRVDRRGAGVPGGS